MSYTNPWITSDEEIWGFDSADDFIWYPDSTGNLIWDFIDAYYVCSDASGRINSGSISNTYIQDDSKLILNEMHYTPGMCYLFSHTKVPKTDVNYYLHFAGSYRGTHDVKFQVTADGTTYVTFFTLDPSTFTQDYYANIPSGSQYFDGDTLTIRIVHEDAGNPGHLLRINYWNIREGNI